MPPLSFTRVLLFQVLTNVSAPEKLLRLLFATLIVTVLPPFPSEKPNKTVPVPLSVPAKPILSKPRDCSNVPQEITPVGAPSDSVPEAV